MSLHFVSMTDFLACQASTYRMDCWWQWKHSFSV